MENHHKHRKLTMVRVFFFCIISTFLLSIQGTLTLTPNESIQGNTTMVSSAGTFEAGFFQFENSQDQYFCIWYKNISPKTTVWVANRDAPVKNSTAFFTLTEQGVPVILDASGSVVWSSNSSRIAKKPVMQLLDSGNLVVQDGDSTKDLLWESFDYPGDTFLAGMKLRTNFVTGPFRFLTSWRNTEDPGFGEFSYHIDAHGYPQLVTTSGELLISRGGSWTGYAFTGVSWRRMLRLVNFSLEINDKEIIYQYRTLEAETITRLVISPSGYVQRLLWSGGSRSWEILSTRPMDQCEYYSFCDVNSLCNVTNSPKLCTCLDGFVPKFYEKWSSQDWSGGCVRRVNLSCHGDRFRKYTGMKLPDTSSSWYNDSLSLEKCEDLCLKNCSCTAYANIDPSGGGCLLWFGDITDFSTHTDQGQDIYMRLEASELDHGGSNQSLNSKNIAGIIVSIVFLVVVLGLTTFTYMKRKKLSKREVLKILFWKYKREREDLELSTIFDFSTISAATNNFSPSNILGEGGFGPVYKGILQDGQDIAVKRLAKTSEQGAEQFKNEVMLMAKLQHRNLVKLHGCSIHQEERLLIYEYMPNRSLDYFIFDSTQSKQVDLTKRLQIIDGIARGLLYLHQDSRLRIIHRDLKASNVLLDNDMNPKISDFGLARTFGGDQAEANTNRVMGTYGYMPPEYALHGHFSIKSDVFSFGVMVMEIISGKKNRNFHDSEHQLNLLSHAWRLWIEEKPVELIDEVLDYPTTPLEVLRCIHVGLLCVQQTPQNRPNMSSVVLMLNGEKVLPEPSPPGFYTGTTQFPIQAESSSRSCGDRSQNEVTMSLLQPR
ncbi:G-type lectin S-receptor-like serine/threonine-protein kinase At4g27290 isoform X2 [Vigna angularis]|uniref:G-type lectin S-receptor-like serine/threonine-protein kinase At4g27290 isoform X2 n=1 Tax=Phaseolus angularis TaxID=3914 RepID=UPI0022B47696|nr:G-type lectin S-receptor-like serine/threonine-protein kinase At4g27290 isoform X2 [Vigna angularis]